MILERNQGLGPFEIWDLTGFEVRVKQTMTWCPRGVFPKLWLFLNLMDRGSMLYGILIVFAV